MAEEAVKKHNHVFIRWFLGHPRVPGAGDLGPRRCIESAIVRTHCHNSMGTLTTMRLLLEGGWFTQFDQEVLLLAISHGAAACVVEFILEQMNRLHNRVQDSSRVYLCAIAGGDVAILRLLERTLDPMETSDPLLMATAAEMGRVDMLEYLLHERGCGCDHRVIQFALMNNHIGAAIWALQNDCPLHATDATTVEELKLREWILCQLQ